MKKEIPSKRIMNVTKLAYYFDKSPMHIIAKHSGNVIMFVINVNSKLILVTSASFNKRGGRKRSCAGKKVVQNLDAKRDRIAEA